MQGDPLPVLLAFLVGWLSGLVFQNSPIYFKIRWWLLDRMPRQCPRCKAWHARRDMEPARHNVADWVRICKKCHDELYNPSQRS